MDLYLAVRGSHESQPRLFPLERGRRWQAGRYAGPLENGRYIRDQGGPVEAIPKYIPLEADIAINLARALDAQRTFELLPILADALDDAGCDDPDLLGHLRQTGVHLDAYSILDALLSRT